MTLPHARRLDITRIGLAAIVAALAVRQLVAVIADEVSRSLDLSGRWTR